MNGFKELMDKYDILKRTSIKKYLDNVAYMRD
jgi:hypothetical protein